MWLSPSAQHQHTGPPPSFPRSSASFTLFWCHVRQTLVNRIRRHGAGIVTSIVAIVKFEGVWGVRSRGGPKSWSYLSSEPSFNSENAFPLGAGPLLVNSGCKPAERAWGDVRKAICHHLGPRETEMSRREIPLCHMMQSQGAFGADSLTLKSTRDQGFRTFCLHGMKA